MKFSLKSWLVFWLLPGHMLAHDWLIDPAPFTATITLAANGRSLVMQNGLIRRTLQLAPAVATVNMFNQMLGEEWLRSVRPEAEIRLNGQHFQIGGLAGQPVHNYLLPEWLSEMTAPPQTFKFVNYTIEPIRPRFSWRKRQSWLAVDRPWPPPGKMLALEFAFDSSAGHSFTGIDQLRIFVHYEIYDGLPLLGKWLTIENRSAVSLEIDSFTSEILALAEPQSAVGDLDHWLLPNVTIETDYAFGGSVSSESCLGKSVFWEPDPHYTTQVNYQRIMPCLLCCRPGFGPAYHLPPGEKFETFRTFELFHDSWDRERKGLAQRQMYRTIAPWVTENPILMHVRQADDEAVKLAIDQCAEVGFELVILTFGSSFNLEDKSAVNLERLRQLAQYAHAKGIALGGYSLLASRSISVTDDVVLPAGKTPIFGHSPCLGSKWGEQYFQNLYQFYQQTGLDVLEHDGSYPGDGCVSTTHPGHRGWLDSQWSQFTQIRDFYRWCRGQGIYLNVPDWYFLNGSNKTGMGYRETNWSLPRAQQELIERQNIFDGTWEKTPSMGWMFVPLTEYQGGGPAATIEPLAEHLPHYEQRLANLFGAGVQACYRGPRLYDGDAAKAVVKKWVDFYKQYRAILDSDIIHVRRPNGRQLDVILHVNPGLPIKGLAFIYNPTPAVISETLLLPLYYTGLTDVAAIGVQAANFRKFKLARDFTVAVPVQVPAQSQTWLVIR
ncbi:alpha-galactosidase [candidate division KSB1 bacterium]|nr:alpha-galactosidase [candidate division KSB1 bacterium]